MFSAPYEISEPSDLIKAFPEAVSFKIVLRVLSLHTFTHIFLSFPAHKLQKRYLYFLRPILNSVASLLDVLCLMLVSNILKIVTHIP